MPLMGAVCETKTLFVKCMTFSRKMKNRLNALLAKRTGAGEPKSGLQETISSTYGANLSTLNIIRIGDVIKVIVLLKLVKFSKFANIFIIGIKRGGSIGVNMFAA